MTDADPLVAPLADTDSPSARMRLFAVSVAVTADGEIETDLWTVNEAGANGGAGGDDTNGEGGVKGERRAHEKLSELQKRVVPPCALERALAIRSSDSSRTRTFSSTAPWAACTPTCMPHVYLTCHISASASELPLERLPRCTKSASRASSIDATMCSSRCKFEPSGTSSVTSRLNREKEPELAVRSSVAETVAEHGTPATGQTAACELSRMAPRGTAFEVVRFSQTERVGVSVTLAASQVPPATASNGESAAAIVPRLTSS